MISYDMICCRTRPSRLKAPRGWIRDPFLDNNDNNNDINDSNDNNENNENNSSQRY